MDALYALASHPLVTTPFMGTPAWVWMSFVAVVIALLAFDLGVLHRDQHEIGVVESLWLSAGYIAAACAFGAWLWWLLGAQSGMEYFTGFLVEKSLSMDNVFVISLVFTYFAVPRMYQHRVLRTPLNQAGINIEQALRIGALRVGRQREVLWR